MGREHSVLRRLLPKHQLEDGLRQGSEGCAQQTGAVPPTLLEDALGVTESSEAFNPVIGTHAAWTDTPEGQIVLYVVHERAVYRDIAGGRAAQDPAPLLAVAA